MYLIIFIDASTTSISTESLYDKAIIPVVAGTMSMGVVIVVLTVALTATCVYYRHIKVRIILLAIFDVIIIIL